MNVWLYIFKKSYWIFFIKYCHKINTFQSSQGWHLMTVLDTHAPGAYTFDEVREKLQIRRLEIEKAKILEALVAEAKKELKIEIFEAAVAEIVLEEKPH